MKRTLLQIPLIMTSVSVIFVTHIIRLDKWKEYHICLNGIIDIDSNDYPITVILIRDHTYNAKYRIVFLNVYDVK